MTASLMATAGARRPVAFGDLGRRNEFRTFRVAAVGPVRCGEFDLRFVKCVQLFRGHGRRYKIQIYPLVTASWGEERLVLRRQHEQLLQAIAAVCVSAWRMDCIVEGTRLATSGAISE